MSRLTQGRSFALPVRGSHPLRHAFPSVSGCLWIVTGLVRVRSPLLAESRLMSFPPGTEMFQFPGFASSTYGFSERYPKGVGCPIRTFTDQSLLAAPHDFSQRATSFIASWCQGIHRMPLFCSRYRRASRRARHARKPSPDAWARDPGPPEHSQRDLSLHVTQHTITPNPAPRAARHDVPRL